MRSGRYALLGLDVETNASPDEAARYNGDAFDASATADPFVDRIYAGGWALLVIYADREDQAPRVIQVARGMIASKAAAQEGLASHCEVAQRFAERLGFCAAVRDNLGQLYERWDGKGYPQGLHGSQIPLPARLMAVADAYDGLTRDREYHAARTHEEAVMLIAEGSGAQFDPVIAAAVLEISGQIEMAINCIRLHAGRIELQPVSEPAFDPI